MAQEEILTWDRRYTPVEMDRISMGYRPKDETDPWLVFQEGNSIGCYLQSNGFCVYRLVLKDGRIFRAYCNPDSHDLDATSAGHSQTLDHLFDNLILGKDGGNRFGRPSLDPELASLDLHDRPIQECKAEMLGYGAKDTGEMGGGASLAISLAGGPDLAPLATIALAATNKQVGDVAFTSALGLEKQGCRALAHIVSIIKHTPEGSWCPKPDSLEHGVARALEFARNVQFHSVAFSALGTGEGRVSPEESARLMFSAIYKYRQNNYEWPLRVILSLPNETDFAAFQQVKQEFR